MKLEPGYYKIQKEDVNAFKTKKNRDNPHGIHLLKVEGTGENQKYFIDGSTIDFFTSDHLKEYDIVSKYDKEPVVQNGHITVTFSDASGQQFSFTTRDTWQLRNIFERYPFLKKLFMFEPRVTK